MAQGYLGSDGVKTSTANQEIIQQHKPETWSASMVIKVYKLTFVNTQACTVIINNSTPIYLPPGNKFECTTEDVPIQTFQIIEPNIEYYYMGNY